MKDLGWRVLISLLSCMIATGTWAQSRSLQPSVVGTWRLVSIESAGPDGKPAQTEQATGLLIYTKDGRAAVQVMYPQTSLSNEFVHDGYEATFGAYELEPERHQLIYHVQASATRDKLAGKSEILHYDFPDARHMIIRPTKVDQHWSVTWARY